MRKDAMKIIVFEQGSAFLAHLALFLYGVALFIVGGDFLNYENSS
jgi:hypothetical protein